MKLEMSPIEFEFYVAEAFRRLGCYDIVVTSHSWDGGIDIRCEYLLFSKFRIKFAIQAKHWSQVVTSPIIQQLRGSLNSNEVGVLVTSGDFSFGARREAVRTDRFPILLINGDELDGIMERICEA